MQKYTLVRDRIWVKKFWEDNHARGENWQVLFQTPEGLDFLRQTVSQKTHPTLEMIAQYAETVMAGRPELALARIECWG